MGSLHLSGSPWFLLLLAPGLWILWRQYRPGARSGGRGRLLLGLQAAALLILAVSLTGPEWVRRSADFHPPALLVLRDRSGSFQGGAYLGLQDAYARAERDIAQRYRERGFEVRVADFHERAWPVSGFRRRSHGADPRAGAAGDAPLTSLAAAADFADSAGGPNLQAVFLFSDGRANLDSGKASRRWPVPVYPVAFPVTALREAQPEEAAWSGPAGSAAGQGGGLEVAWRDIGAPGGGPVFRILQGGKAAFSGALAGGAPDSGATGAGGAGDGLRRSRIPWSPAPGAGRAGWRLVLQPGGGAGNPDPYNDTLPIGDSRASRGGRRIVVIKPLRSLDEKGMADFLHAWSDAAVSMVAPEDLPGGPAGAGDQVWVEAGALAARPALLKALRESPAKVVVYGRPGSLPGEIAGVPVRPAAFSTAAEVRPSRAAADAFPDAVVRLGSVASGGMSAPSAQAPWREAAALSEGGRRGLLMAWFPLAPGKEGLFLALPPMWDLLFDPQADFAVRENLDGLLRAASRLAERQEGAVKASRPAQVYAGVPFDMEFTLPPPGKDADGKPGGDGGLEIKVIDAASGKAAESWRLTGPGPDAFRLEGRSLPEGRWILELRRGGRGLWRDSLASVPKEALELARIGFDGRALGELAGQSGGRVIAPGSGGDGGVTSLLPEIPGAQVRSEKTRSTRLYNTPWQFALAVALLAASWLLRKRWDLD